MTSNQTSSNAARRDLVARIARDATFLSGEVQRAVMWPGVLDTMASVRRELFVAPGTEEDAYLNVPLPIGHGQTISQPFIVALMTGALRPEASHRVLEVGTGSGYQAAVLSALVKEVYSVEIVPELAQHARAALSAAGVTNVEVRVGDGHAGWPDAAPFDGIIITAAADEIPQTLVGQLKPGGRMVLPVGRTHQMLTVITRDQSGATTRQDLLPVRFVPFVGN